MPQLKTKQTLLFLKQEENGQVTDQFLLPHDAPGPVNAPDWVTKTKLYELALSDDTLEEVTPKAAKTSTAISDGRGTGLQGAPDRAKPGDGAGKPEDGK